MKTSKSATFLASCMLMTLFFCYSIKNFDLSLIIFPALLVAAVLVVRRIEWDWRYLVPIGSTIAVFLFSISSGNGGTARSYFPYFVLFSALSIVLLSVNHDLDRLATYTSGLLFACLPTAIVFFVTTSDVGTLLGATYAALPPYLLTMTVALKRGAWTVGRAAALVNCLVYGFFFITKGNRGALVAVCCYLLIRTIGAGKNGWSKFMRAGVLIGGIVVVLNHVIPILEALNRALASFGIQADGINKTLDIWSAGQDIDNGRDYLWTRSLDALPCPETCVTGGGIGFAESTLGTYAHNLIIQHMMEGGILYALVPSVSVILAVWLLFRGKNWFLVASIAVTGVFIPLMLSNVYWVQPTYWLATYFLWSSPARSRSLGVASDSDEAAPSLKSPFGLKSGAQLRPYVAQ